MSDLDEEKINLEREQVIEKIIKWLKEEGHKIESGRHSKAHYFGIHMIKEYL